jgi:hypothetical protein
MPPAKSTKKKPSSQPSADTSDNAAEEGQEDESNLTPEEKREQAFRDLIAKRKKGSNAGSGK